MASFFDDHDEVDLISRRHGAGIGIIMIVLGFLVYASPSPDDQWWGRIVGYYGLGLVVLSVLAKGRAAGVARMLACLPPILFLGYCATKNV